MRLVYIFFFSLCASVICTASNTFPLTDTSPDSPEFRARFLGSYGINSAIEPTINQQDRPLYESIVPYLQKDPEKAIKLAIKGINSKSNAAFDFLVGSLYYGEQDYDQAEHYLKQAIEKFPDFRRAHRNLSLIYILRQDYAAAIPHLLTVVKLGGGDAQSYSMLGYSYLNQEKYQSALSAYQMARLFAPDSKDVRRGEAQCLLMTQQLGPAIALFDELIAENPNEKDYWLLQANSYLAQQRFEEAIANIEIAHTIAPASWETHKLLADLYINQNLTLQALENYKAAIKANPKISAKNALQPLRQLIERNLYIEAADYLNVLNSSLQSTLSEEEAIEKQVLAAQLELEVGISKEGIKQLKNILKTDPLNTDALLALAGYYLNEENYAEAEFYFERAQSIPEVQVEALVGLARVNVEQGRFAEAIPYLQKAQSVKPRNDIKRFIASIENALNAYNNKN